MPLFVLSLIIQACLIVHVIKTGRDQKWIMLLTFLPGIGAAIYIFVELAPEFLSSSQGRAASKQVRDTLNPHKDLKEASKEYELSSTVANANKLAAELKSKGQFDAASELYRDSLTGLNEFNPDTMHELAQCEFELNNHVEVNTLLDSLIEHNPEYKNQDAHLLYARNLQQLGDIDKAKEEYEALVVYYTGPEPTYRYGMLLKEAGDTAGAQQQFESVIKKADLTAKHYRVMHKQWIDLSRKELP